MATRRAQQTAKPRVSSLRTPLSWHKHAPSAASRNRVIDAVMAVAAVLHPLTALPQVVQIYATQSAEGVSLATWVGFMVLGLVYLSYAAVHRLKPLIVNQVMWFVLDVAVIVGVLLYG